MEKRRSLTPSQKRLVRERFGECCGCGCKEPLEGRIHYDHVLPLWLGGSNELDNFAPLKAHHHIAKTAKEATTRGKVRRIAKKHAGEYKKSPSRWGKQKLQSRSSFSEWLGFDGTKRKKKP